MIEHNLSEQHARTAIGARGWIRTNTLRGLDIAVADTAILNDILIEHGFNHSIIQSPVAIIPARKMALLLETIAERLDISDIGMRIALHQRKFSIVDPIELAICNAPTLMDAFSFGERHVDYYSPSVKFNIEYESDGEDVCLHYEFLADDVLAYQATEAGCLIACRIIIDLAKARPKEVWFRHQPQSDISVYERNFETRVRFNMPRDAIYLDKQDFHKPFLNRDSDLYEYGQEIAARRQAQSKPLSALVQEEIERLLPIYKCSYDLACDHMGLTPRTMRRYLAIEQTTFKNLKDNVRSSNVKAALGQIGIRQADLARHAGYYDSASIRRNIKRWM